MTGTTMVYLVLAALTVLLATIAGLILTSPKSPLRQTRRADEEGDVRVEIRLNQKVGLVVWVPREVLNERGFLGLGEYLATSLEDDLLASGRLAAQARTTEAEARRKSRSWQMRALAKTSSLRSDIRGLGLIALAFLAGLPFFSGEIPILGLLAASTGVGVALERVLDKVRPLEQPVDVHDDDEVSKMTTQPPTPTDALSAAAYADVAQWIRRGGRP